MAIGGLPIAAGPIFAALEEQVKTNEEALQTLKVLEKNFSADFAVFRGVCDQLFIKIAKEHPESKKFVGLYRDYTDAIFDLSNSANEDDFENVHATFKKISKLGMAAEAKELLDKLFLATKGLTFKAKTSEQWQEYYKKLFVPTILNLLKYLDKNGLNPKLHKEIRKLLISSNFQEYLGLFVVFLLMLAFGGFAIPLVGEVFDKDHTISMIGGGVFTSGLIGLFSQSSVPAQTASVVIITVGLFLVIHFGGRWFSKK